MDDDLIGENDLPKLLQSMSPLLLEQEYVFATFAQAKYGDHANLQPFASVIEAEGLTLIIEKSTAERHDIEFHAVFKAITLQVHSSLEAVGLTAAVATKLAECGVSANVVAGYFHDHIFVQSESAELAVSVLSELADR